MTQTQNIEKLAAFAVQHGLVEEEDRLYAINSLLDVMKLAAPEECAAFEGELPPTVTPMLSELCDAAASRGLIADTQGERELFATRLCGCITPAPAVVRAKFQALHQQEGPQAAIAWFYEMCRACDYIRVDQIAKNVRFFADSPAGELEITINLSKPEKDPRDIAAQKNAPQVSYPKCMLCIENPGYAGRLGFPARQNHRMIPLTLNGEGWHMQYSPYLYYPEHCIVLCDQHRPMRISENTFKCLFDFVGQFPHYLLGSNADLPIVGGSILSHDHFQGGSYSFPMDKAADALTFKTPAEGVSAAVIDWPLTTVRLRGKDEKQLQALAVQLLSAWREYSDPSCDILAHTDAPHNTVTPILRKCGEEWRLDLVLRNNRTSEEHPLGIFHPHAPLHHLKKENIGLIEVMGLFILPGRLLSELGELRGYLTGALEIAKAPEQDSPLAKHYEWVCEIAQKTGTNLTDEQAEAAIRSAVAETCAQVLCDAGVYKQDARGREGVTRFLASIGYTPC